VRVRVHSTGLCTSDVYGYSGRNTRRDDVLTGDGAVLVMGHEAAGVVDALGPGVEDPRLAAGTPVAVNPIFGCGECALCARGDENLCLQRTVHGCAPDAPGGFADYLVVPAANVEPLADGVSLELGALVEPLAVGHHGVRLAGLEPRQRVLVVGGGIVGLGAALSARRTVGAEGVLVLEPREDRRALAAQLGLEAAHPDDVLGVPGDSGFDVAVDCVARPETFAGAVRAVPRQGLVVLVGIWEDEIPLPVSEVVGRETCVIGSYGYNHADFRDVARWVGGGEVDLTPLIQHRVGYDTVVGAFDAYADGSLTAVRTLFQPEGT